MYQIDITQPAKQDLQEAVTYVAAELKNPQAAENLLNLADKTIGSLAEMPLRHALAADEVLSQLGIRFVPVGNYLAFYIVKKNEKKISILRFLYGRRDWLSILQTYK